MAYGDERVELAHLPITSQDVDATSDWRGRTLSERIVARNTPGARQCQDSANALGAVERAGQQSGGGACAMPKPCRELSWPD